MMKRLMALVLALLCLMPCAAMGEEGKAVYLTFDDGPKRDTPELLALLEELDVPATFFFMGLSVKAFPEYAKMVVDAGYPVGCHTMSHKPSAIKEDPTYVGRDLRRFENIMRELVDPEFATDIFRFPGGGSSYPRAAKQEVAAAGYAWFDWNAMTGDTMSGMKTQDLYDYATKTGGSDEVIILLMHEGKSRTRAILPDLVAHYKEMGYTFRTLSTSAQEREILQRCPAAMGWPEAQ